MKMQCVRSVFSQWIGNLPFFREREEFPVAPACFGAVIMAVQLLPERILPFTFPDYLRVRTAKDVLPPLLELFSAGTVENTILFPIVCNEHEILLEWLCEMPSSS